METGVTTYLVQAATILIKTITGAFLSNNTSLLRLTSPLSLTTIKKSWDGHRMDPLRHECRKYIVV